MAEAVLEIALEKLGSFIGKELGLFLGFHQNLKRLTSLLTTIKATLEDAEEKQFSNTAIKDWLQKLKDAAYVLDDILDECAYETLQLEYQGVMCGPSAKVQSSCLSSFHPKHLVFRYKIAKKMEEISQRLEEISGERTKFHLTETVSERKTGVSEWRQTTSIITQPQVYGREEDKDKILDFLVSDASHSEDLSVYTIKGLGGLGKTTLAQLIFNHERVVNHFETRIWVCVSEDFSLKRMTKAIIEAASGHACEDLDLEPLQRRLQDLLQRKRYLLVLDDIWDDDQEKWRRLKSVLACGAKGASILVTTRIQTVASIMGTTSPHELSQLSDNDCWKLFKQRAFEANEMEREELVVIGKEIVDKCGGVPLAAIALGSLLRFKREEKQWLYVKDSPLWNLQDENLVMPALRLSYLNLPVKLRQCFSFCAIFPKDQIIEKQYLIELWMANGFISSNDVLDAEEIGDDVWNELYWRSFFQDIETDEFGKVQSFKMHDLVHDLAQYVTEEVWGITNDNDVINVSERIRHLSSYGWKLFENGNAPLAGVKSLKTFIMPDHDDYIQQRHLLKYYSLRVLDLERVSKLSSSIGHLKHLRYLNLSWGYFKSLPESLCKLWNLQILKLDYCVDLVKLPNSLIRLKALQHLSLNDCISLSSLPPEIGKLSSLRNLSMYIVGKERGFLLAELGQLNLKGDLHIKNLEKLKSLEDAKEANMWSKNLNKLLLSWDKNEECQVQENVEQILEVLQPQLQQLETLEVREYKGSRFPQWMSSPSLKYLYHLELWGCTNILQLTEFGKLPSLKHLVIDGMIHIKYLYEESYDGGVFMALELLKIKALPNLIRLSREEGENMFLRLSKFEIDECPKLSGFPSLPSLDELHISGESNQDLLISIHKLTSLESLCFKDNEELICFPNGMLQNLTSLKKLHFDGLSKIEVLPIEIINLSAIQELHVSCCNSLRSLSNELLQGLHSLKILHVKKCHKFNLSTGFQYLTSLEDLRIESSSEVEVLHDALQHMTALQSLKLVDLPNIKSLPDWLGNLSLLQRLHISVCPNLRCLPTSIQRLTGLKKLRVYHCPELEKRCQKEIGEDWQKIAHVSLVDIGY
ncbi:hypothetical protein VNO77_40035 [Canavalia gladiata]|uniref:Uncharacterized protein n=1 Tax=Canavalia gladiata TaxID=3824 RepID=A0AAN9JZB9_CANGL